MADFCRECVREMWDHDASDFPAEAGWYLCEGCGAHYFDAEGRRICRLPTPDETQACIDACPTCLAKLRAEFNP